MSSKPGPRKLTTWNLHGRVNRRNQPPHIRNVDNGQLYDPVETFSRNPKSKVPNNPKESFDPKALGYKSSNRGLDRSCFVKPQLKDVAQLTQSLKRDDQNRPCSAKSQHGQNGGPVGRKGYPRQVSPSDVRGLQHSKYVIPHLSLVPDLINQKNHSTSPPPPHPFAVSRYLPGAKIPHYQHIPRPIRHSTSARNPKARTDFQWRARSKSKPRNTPGVTTIEELEKYITISGTRLDPKPKPPAASGRRKTIEELKQYLVTSESFEISRAQKSPAAGNVPRTPGPPNVTPKASFEYTDTSNLQFDSPYSSPTKMDVSLTNVDIDKMQPAAGVMVDQLQALKKLLCTDVQKVENSSQFTDEGMVPIGVATSENMWQIVESVGDVAKLLDEDTMTDDLTNEQKPDLRSVVVSEKPRIKVIAEKFSKYKKNNIELRKLEEKVVCLEYDVYGKDGGSKFTTDPKATQVLRAYFSVKPNCKHGDGKGCHHDVQFTKLKEHFVSESQEDTQTFGGKEIEIIDGNLEENHCYIQDLVKVLSNKKVIETKKNKTALDVLSLYDMAKTQSLIDEEDIHFLNHSQLAEVKEMILKTCESNTNVINRRKLCYQEDKLSAEEVLNVSKSIINELYRESRKL